MIRAHPASDSLPKCPVCSSAEQQIGTGAYGDKALSLADDSPFASSSIYECGVCGIAYAYPLPSESEVTEYYSSPKYWDLKTRGVDLASYDWEMLFSIDPGLNERMWRAIRASHYIHRTVPDINKKTRVLDIGCGWGPLLFVFKAWGMENLTALEPSEKSGSYLSDQGILVIDSALEDYLNSGVREEYDLVVLSHVLEHLSDPAAALEGIRHLVADDGYLYLEVPRRDDLQSKLIEGHVVFFDEKSISTVLGGYEMIGAECFWSGARLRERHRLPALGSRLFKSESVVFQQGDNNKQIGLHTWQRLIAAPPVDLLRIGLTTDSVGVICSPVPDRRPVAPAT